MTLDQHAAPAPWPPRAPDDSGMAGVAWCSRWELRAEDPIDWTATVARWVVTTALGQMLVNMIHLRPIEGQSRPPSIHLEGATHELVVLLPKAFVHEPDALIDHGPMIVTVQINLGDDAAAQKLAHFVVHRMVGHGDHPVAVASMLARGVKPACPGPAS